MESLDVPQADDIVSPDLLAKLEMDAKELSDSLSLMVGGLSANLHAFGAVTRQYLQAHETAVNSLCDGAHDSLNEMAELVAKCEEINDNMKPVESLVTQIHAIKDSLSTLEYAFNRRLEPSQAHDQSS